MVVSICAEFVEVYACFASDSVVSIRLLCKLLDNLEVFSQKVVECLRSKRIETTFGLEALAGKEQTKVSNPSLRGIGRNSLINQSK